MAEPNVSKNLRLPESLYRRVKVQAAREGATVSSLLVEALEALLKARREATKREAR